MGVKVATVPLSPRSAADMIRLKRRSKRSRGDMALMSGAGPADRPLANGAAAPGLAMSGTTGAAVPRSTRQTIAATSRTASPPATIQAVCSDLAAVPPAAAAPGPAGWPHRWQKRARLESSAEQAAQRRGPRTAPHRAQKVPDASAPQAGQRPGAEGGRAAEG